MTKNGEQALLKTDQNKIYPQSKVQSQNILTQILSKIKKKQKVTIDGKQNIKKKIIECPAVAY